MINNLKKLLTWPSTEENNLYSWPRIVWVCIVSPILYLGFALSTFAVLLTLGYKEAKYFWDDLGGLR